MSEGFELARYASTPEYLRLRPQYVGAQGKYQIGELGFSNKKAIKEYFGAMRNYHFELGTITGEPALGDLRALFALHPRYGDTTPAIFRVQASAEGEYPSICFAFVRADGTGDTFSIDGCTASSDPEKDAINACRVAVAADIRAAMDGFFEEHAGEDGRIECDRCATRVPRAEVHADHAAPATFEVIQKGFIAARGIDLTTFTHKPPGSMEGQKIRDPAMLEAFIRYHHTIANLRPLCPKCNMWAGHLFRINDKDRQLILRRRDT